MKSKANMKKLINKHINIEIKFYISSLKCVFNNIQCRQATFLSLLSGPPTGQEASACALKLTHSTALTCIRSKKGKRHLMSLWPHCSVSVRCSFSQSTVRVTLTCRNHPACTPLINSLKNILIGHLKNVFLYFGLIIG